MGDIITDTNEVEVVDEPGKIAREILKLSMWLLTLLFVYSVTKYRKDMSQEELEKFITGSRRIWYLWGKLLQSHKAAKERISIT